MTLWSKSIGLWGFFPFSRLSFFLLLLGAVFPSVRANFPRPPTRLKEHIEINAKARKKHNVCLGANLENILYCSSLASHRPVFQESMERLESQLDQ